MLEASLRSSGELPDELLVAEGSAAAPEPFEEEESEEPEGSEDPSEEPAEEAEGDAGADGAGLGPEPLEPLEGLAPLPLPLPLPLLPESPPCGSPLFPFPFPLPLLGEDGAGLEGFVVVGVEVGDGA